jgi:HAD superfamily hydrolase (TIGR01509 family)
MKALIFDCDGVLVDSERDGHRVAFNQAFAQQGLKVEWDVDQYGRLLSVGGGKERMCHYFDSHGWPPNVSDPMVLINRLHKRKTDLFMQIVEGGQLPLRSGIRRLVDEAARDGILLAVCSTSNERSVNLIVEKLLGAERKAQFKAILAGDIAARKKPDPAIYHLALERLGVKGAECVVVEDSRNGLLAAKSAGMHCLVTISAYTAHEDFGEADRVVNELGDPPGQIITLADLKQLAAEGRPGNSGKI